MVIEAYSGFSKPLNSTKQPSGAGTQLNVRLKDATSVLNPTFLVTAYNLSHNYVKWGSRYYFIEDINIVGNELAEYICTSDPMATYKTGIGSSNQYVLRSASSSSGYVTDSYYPLLARKIVSTSSQANGFIFPFGGAYIIGIQGETTSSSFGSTTYYVMDVDEVQNFLDEVFNVNNAAYEAASVSAMADIPEAIYKSIINPQQYIVSCMYLPFDPETLGAAVTSPVKVGWYELDGVRARVFDPSFETLPSVSHTFSLPDHPQIARGVYMNNSPFTQRVLSFMPFGEIPLPCDMLLGASNIHCKCIVDVITGQSTLRIYRGTSDSGDLIDSRSAQVGVPIAVSGGIYNYSPKSMLNSGIAGLFASAANIGMGQGILDAGGDIVSAVSSPTISTMGSNGALDFLEYDAMLVNTFTYAADNDTAQHGQPLCAVRTINTLSGYVQVLKPDIDLPAAPSEKAAIAGYMSNGFFYE